MVFYATLGIIVGGRLAYVFFYQPSILANPLDVFKLWEGGMSFHGGVVGVSLGILYLSWKNKLNWLRIHDYVACCVPIGLFFGRLANFVNGELWGKATNVPWAVIFPNGKEVPRHPSQLYEAALEGLALFALLAFLAFATDARRRPGTIGGAFLAGYGTARAIAEIFREPDGVFLGISTGPWYSLPMILAGLWLIARARRRPRFEGAPAPA